MPGRYFALIKHVNSTIRKRFVYQMAQEGIIKWLWSALGLGVCAIPVFFDKSRHGNGSSKKDLGSQTEGWWLIYRLSQILTPRRCCVQSKTTFEQ